MNMYHHRIGIVLLGLCLSICPLMGDTIEEVEGSGLHIETVPAKARVYIDGIERGLTPLTLGSLSPGEYHIRISKDGFRDRRLAAKVKKGSRLTISLILEELRGQILVDITRDPKGPPEDKLPQIPEITAEGQRLRGPLVSLPEGFRTIRVRAFGWEEISRTVYVIRDITQRLTVELKPASFLLKGASVRRARFNPENSGSLGTTEFSFEVTAPGEGTIQIKDKNGDTVFFRDLRPFSTWSQSLIWDGRSADGRVLPEGNYEVLIETRSIPWDDSEPVIQRAELSAAIDRSIEIYPLSLSSGVSGLLFSPASSVIPAGAFQIDGSLLFGRAPVSLKAWRTIPYAAAFRFSPIKQFEFAMALNVNPEFDADTIWGMAGSVKWEALIPREEFPLGLAAGISYGWAKEGTVTPFGMGTGVQLFLPLSWRLGPAFSLLLSPAVLWTGSGGYPSEAAPRVLLSGGLMFRHSFITAGLSLRSEYLFSSRQPIDPQAIMLGGELKFFPPPSSFVFTLLGGGWFRNGEKGAFGGAGIGLIY
jgi:hypothetical protein